MDKLSSHGFGNEIRIGIEISINGQVISYDAENDFQNWI